MNKDVLQRVLDIEFAKDIGIQKSELKQVVASVETAVASDLPDAVWQEAIEAALHKIRSNPLAQEKMAQAKVALSEAAATCAICQQPAVLVTLYDNRSAYYCPTHRVVNPAFKKVSDDT